ncbi:MAG TPA: hypothetical protein VHC69_30075 [Polyangiaceae bacterium]|nr:hypothetical protein [Polyangiaceae bacterium]
MGFGVLGAAVLCVVLDGCGSDVIVAEQGRRSDASNAADAGDVFIDDAGDTSSFRLCGTARCTDFSLPLSGQTIQLFACCADARRSACGIVEGTQCAELHYPGHLDMNCTSIPPQVTNGLGEELPGCCRKDNTCGFLDTEYGFGCAQIQIPPFFSGGIPCTY